MIEIYDLCVNNAEQPTFSWKLKGDSDQDGYRIRVLEKGGNEIWDSGRRDGGERHNIRCGIRPAPEEVYEWEVECFGNDGSSDRQKGEPFGTGISEWMAKWVKPDRTRKPQTDSTKPHASSRNQKVPEERLDPAVYIRKEFVLEDMPEQGLAYVTAHGIYRLWINGILVSDLLAPGFTSYGSRLEYQVYQISSHLRTGKNVIAAVLADGWYSGKIGAVGIGQQFGEENALLLQIKCRYGDGRVEYICSGETMKWNTGAWKYADLFVGEYYDARAERKGWQDAGYDDAGWQKVRLTKRSYEVLAPQGIPPVRILKTIQPRILKSPRGERILDAGETIVGFVSFQLNLKSGDVITMEHSETLDRDGNYLQNIIGQNKDQTDIYVCAEDGEQRWQPQLSFHGFRYVRINGIESGAPENFTIHVIGTPLCQTGTFTCSDQRLNQLQENILRSQQGNMICIPTDCPQRERTGWTGDMQMYAPTACYEQDVEQFLRHWLQDMESEQLEDGQIPHIVPYIPSHDIMKPPGLEGVSAAGWSDAAVLVPWRLYEAYGDRSILKECFPMMQSYMESTAGRVAEMPEGAAAFSEERKARQKYLWNTGFQFGDWLMPSVQMSGSSIMEVAWETGYEVATLMYALTTAAMADICDVLGKRELSAHYREVNKQVRAAYAAEYMNDDGTMKKDYQGIYVLALAADAVPPERTEAAVERLVTLIHENNDLLDTGFLSVPYLLPVLYEKGQKELARKLLFRDECPSWLYEVKMGATTMWEYWNGYAEDGTPNNCSMNHFAFGCIGEYLFRTILGIQPVSPGYQKVLIKPDTECGLLHAEGSYDSIWGKIEVSWRIEGEKVVLEAVIPPNVEAELVLGGKRVTGTCGRIYLGRS